MFRNGILSITIAVLESVRMAILKGRSRPDSMGWTPPPLNGIQVPDWECYPPVKREKESTMNKPGCIGIDLTKNVFQLHVGIGTGRSYGAGG